MSICYIQKKIKDIWRTVLMVDSTGSQQAFDHLCKQYCKYKFRISTNKTDDMPTKPSSGLTRNEALDALCNIKLVDLTWKQSTETFIEIADIILRVCKGQNTIVQQR